MPRARGRARVAEEDPSVRQHALFAGSRIQFLSHYFPLLPSITIVVVVENPLVRVNTPCTKRACSVRARGACETSGG